MYSITQSTLLKKFVKSLRQRGFTTFGTVEKHPGAKVGAEILEAVPLARRHEQDLAGLKWLAGLARQKIPAAGRNYIDLIARVRLLGIDARRLIKLNGQAAMTEQLGETAITPQHCRACIGQRQARRCRGALPRGRSHLRLRVFVSCVQARQRDFEESLPVRLRLRQAAGAQIDLQ